MKLCTLRSSPTAFSGDQLITAIGLRSDNNRLNHPARSNRCGQFVERGFIEMPTGLAGMRLDPGDCQHRQAARSGHRSIV
jgi:hypothetical protein